MLWLVFALALGAQEAPPPTSTPAPVTATETPAAPAAAAAPDDDDRVICVMEMQAGSHFKKKTCLTKAQWKKRRERDRGAAERALTADLSDSK